MKKTKNIALCLAGILTILSIAGCGESQTNENKGQEADASNIVLAENGETLELEEATPSPESKVEPTPYVNPEAVITNEPGSNSRNEGRNRSYI